MSTYLLVHGAYHGGWCWRPVASRLRAEGHEVHTPTLTGLGERSHLLSAGTGLSTHVADVVQVIDFENLDDVVLVGHSYGAVVCSAVASCRPGRVAVLVNLDGPVACAGESAAEANGSAEEIRSRVRLVDGVEVLPVRHDVRMGVEDDHTFAWLLSKQTAQPFRALSEPLCLEHPYSPSMRKVYLLCSAGGRDRPYLARVDAAGGWTYLEIDCGHDAMIAAPGELSAILGRLADDAAPTPCQPLPPAPDGRKRR